MTGEANPTPEILVTVTQKHTCWSELVELEGENRDVYEFRLCFRESMYLTRSVFLRRRNFLPHVNFHRRGHRGKKFPGDRWRITNSRGRHQSRPQKGFPPDFILCLLKILGYLCKKGRIRSTERALTSEREVRAVSRHLPSLTYFNRNVLSPQYFTITVHFHFYHLSRATSFDGKALAREDGRFSIMQQLLTPSSGNVCECEHVSLEVEDNGRSDPAAPGPHQCKNLPRQRSDWGPLKTREKH